LPQRLCRVFPCISLLSPLSFSLSLSRSLPMETSLSPLSSRSCSPLPLQEDIMCQLHLVEIAISVILCKPAPFLEFAISMRGGSLHDCSHHMESIKCRLLKFKRNSNLNLASAHTMQSI
jgi:hypothetical protein